MADLGRLFVNGSRQLLMWLRSVVMGTIFASLSRRSTPLPVEIASTRRLILEAYTGQSLGLQDISRELAVVTDNFAEDAAAQQQRIRSELRAPIAVNVLELDRRYESLPNSSKRYFYPTTSKCMEINIDLEDIFKASEESPPMPSWNSEGRDQPPPTRNIFVAGAAGSGKSHLFTKIVPFMWANGWLWADRFDLVACFDLCREDVCQANDMAQLLSTYLHDKVLDDGECSAAYFSQAGHGERLCLIFDGLSECVVEDCSEFMRDVLCRRKWRTTRVIVLSRQLADALIVDQHEGYDRFLQVTGFAQGAAEAFIMQCLFDDQAKLLLGGDKTSDQMALPVMALSTCEAVEAGMERPLCLTGAVECSVLLAIEKAGRGRYKSLQEIPDDVYAALSHLSHFAVESLMDRRYAFRLAHLEEANLALPSSRLHLLNPGQEVSSLNAAIWFRFSSVSVQEFLSAWYLSTHFLQSSYHAAALVERLDHRTGHLDMLWHYLIAMLPTPLAGSIARYVWVKIRGSNDRLYELPLGGGQAIRELLRESSGELLCENELRDLVAELQVEMAEENMHALANTLLSSSSLVSDNGHQLVLANIPSGQQPYGTAYLVTLLSLWQQRQGRRAQTAACFYDALRDVDGPAAIACKSRFLPDWLIGGAIEALVDAFEYLQPVTDLHARAVIRILEAYYEHRLPHPTLCPPQQFSLVDVSMPRLGVHVRSTPMNPYQCTVVAFALACYPDSKGSLVLNDCHISDIGLARIVPALLACSNLHWLELDHCDITDAKPLVSVLHNLRSLTSLSLGDNPIGDDGFALLETALVEMKSLWSTTFSNTGLTGASLPVMSRLITAWPRVEWFHVYGNDFLSADDEAHADLVEAVRAASQLHHFYVKHGSLREKFAEEIEVLLAERKEARR